MKRLLPLALLAVLGVAVADTAVDSAVDDTAVDDTADSADTGDTAAPHDSEPLESGAFLEETGGPPGGAVPDTGDTGDTGFEELPCHERGLFVGDLTFSSVEALEDWSAEYGELTGTLRLVGLPLEDLGGLACVRSVGSLEVEGMPALRSIRLELDAQRVSLVGNPLLEDVELAMPALPGGLVVAENPALRQLDVPVYLAGDLSLQDLGAAYVELDELVLVEGDLRLSGLGGAVDLARLTRVDGDLLMRDLNSRDLRWLRRLVHVGGDVEIVAMPALRSLEGPELTRLNRMALVNLPQLGSLKGLESLVEVSTLRMEGLPELRDLSGLENLDRLDAVEGERRYRKLLKTE